MPTYSYKCSSCSHEWEDISTISKRLEPTENPCPNCSRTGFIEIMVGGNTSIVDPWIMGGIKPSSAFRERLQEIKKAHPKGNFGRFA